MYSTFGAPLPTAEGYRVIWVHNSDKAIGDAATRAARIEAGTSAIDALATKLAGPKCRLKTRANWTREVRNVRSTAEPSSHFRLDPS